MKQKIAYKAKPVGQAKAKPTGQAKAKANPHGSSKKIKSLKKRKMTLNSSNWITKSFSDSFKINDSSVSNGNCF